MKVEVNDNSKKLSKMFKETCGLVGEKECKHLKIWQSTED